MSTQLTFRRGTKDENDNFTGASGEITFDETNKKVRVHDGSKRGGFPIPKDNEVVHLTGNESISGIKTFTSIPFFNNSTSTKEGGEIELSPALEQTERGYLDVYYDPTTEKQYLRMRVGNDKGTLKIDSDGYSYAKTTASNSNDDSIATTKWANDKISSEAVYKTGNKAETITGVKTFSSEPKITARNIKLQATNLTKGSVPESNIYWGYEASSNDSGSWQNSRLGKLEWCLNTNNVTTASLMAFKNEATSQTYAALAVKYDTANDKASATAPTLDYSSNGNEIVTANSFKNIIHEWFNNGMYVRKVDTLFAGPLGSGTINLNAPYDNYTFLLVDGGNDSKSNVNTMLIPVWCINQARSHGQQWALWMNASGNYWYCAASSTTTSLISGSENSVIFGIYGIKI